MTVSPEAAPTPAPDPSDAIPVRPAGMGMRALRNTGMLLATRVASRIIALVSVLTIGHALGDTAFGQMQTAVTYVGLVGTITDLGLSALYVREGARHVNAIGRFWNNIASVKLVLSLLSVPPLFGLLWVAGIQSLLIPAFALSFLSGYQLLLRNSLYAMQQLGFEIIEILPETAIVLVMAVLGARFHLGAAYFLWAYTASYFFACIYFAIVLWRKCVLRPRFKLEMPLLRPWIRAAIPLGITFIITTVYFKVDVPILQRFRSYDEVGWYTLAYKPFEALLFIPFSLRGVVFPLLSVYHRQSPERVLALSEKFFKALLLLGWPATVGIFLLAPQFNSLLGLFNQSEPALQILALAIVFMFADNTFAATLNAIDKQNVFAFVALVGLVVNVGVNLVVIPRYGYLGASWAVVVTEAALVVVGWFVLRAQLGAIRIVHSSWKIIVAGTVMGIFLWFVQPQGRVALFGVVAGAAVIYFAVLAILRVADDEEMNLIRNALRIRR